MADALPGIVMLCEPRVGFNYYAPGIGLILKESRREEGSALDLISMNWARAVAPC